MQATVLIAGLGLIGGSLAEAIRSVHPEITIIGYDIDPTVRAQAEAMGIVDKVAGSLTGEAGDADWIILAAPVSAILDMIHTLGRVRLKRQTIVTDVGSTKRQIICQAKQELKDKCLFIGGHPMAGSHKSGIAAARSDLFENAYYFLIPSGGEDAAVRSTQDLLKGTRAKFFRVSADQHDRIVGLISHFPHLIASSLVHHLADHPVSGVNLRLLAAGGFRDITRIASSDPTMWTDIVLSNRDQLLEMLDGWSGEMERLKQRLIANDKAAIYSFFKKAKEYRDGFPKKTRGVLPGYFDLYVDIPDRPDMISKVTGHIGREGINLVNIEIIEAREDVFGVLRLTFQKEADRNRALRLLQQKGLHTYLNE